MEQILSLCREGKDELLVTSLTLKDASYLFENGASFKRVAPDRQFRSEQARRIRELAFATCTICGIDEDIARKAHQNLSEPDYDDALVAECALAYDAEVIISSDKEAFERSIVPKASPQRYAKLMAKREQAQD